MSLELFCSYHERVSSNVEYIDKTNYKHNAMNSVLRRIPRLHHTAPNSEIGLSVPLTPIFDIAFPPFPVVVGVDPVVVETVVDDVTVGLVNSFFESSHSRQVVGNAHDVPVSVS
jgi:hypothetical protein